MKPCYPNMDDYANLREQYVTDWNKLNNDRQ